MERNYRELIMRVVLGALVIASLAVIAACGGGGSSTQLPPASGSVVWSLSSNPTTSLDDQPYGMVFSSSSGSSLYIVGYDSDTAQGDDQWRIEKRDTSNGSLVASFGTTTGVIVNNPSGTDFLSFDDALAVAADTVAIYAVGFDSEAGNDDWAWHIEKRDLVTGVPVTIIHENNSVGFAMDDAAFAVAVDSSPTGTMYIVGYETPGGKGTEWRIEARDKVTGNLISAVTSSLTGQDEGANAIAIDPVEGYMYVVGSDYFSGDEGWRIEKRTLSAPLSLETVTFGTSGFIHSQPSVTGGGAPYAIALDSTSIYIAGDEAYGVGASIFSRWRIEKRNRFTGAPDATFGTGGVVKSNTTTSAGVNAMAIDGDYMYLAGFDNTASGFLEWRIEKRSLATGALVSSFGSGGVIVNDFSSPLLDDSARAIAVDSSHIYVAGYESVNNSDSRWRIMKLLK